MSYNIRHNVVLLSPVSAYKTCGYFTITWINVIRHNVVLLSPASTYKTCPVGKWVNRIANRCNFQVGLFKVFKIYTVFWWRIWHHLGRLAFWLTNDFFDIPHPCILNLKCDYETLHVCRGLWYILLIECCLEIMW